MSRKLNKLIMYEALLQSTVDKDHKSDWCQGQTQQQAKNAARANYVRKYPNDDLNKTEFHVRTVTLAKGKLPVVTLEEMVSTFRKSLKSKSFLTSAPLADDDGDDLFSLVKESKEAPGSTSIAAVNTTGAGAEGGKPTSEALSIYNDMLVLSSLANVVSMKGVYDEHPEKYNITDPKEASIFIQKQVVNLNDTFTRRLGAYALPGETTAQHFSKEVLTADLHLEFLTTLFSTFEFPATAIKKLDGILTQVKDTLANLKIGFESQDQTLDHMIFVNYIEAVDIEGIPEKVLVGKIRLFYLKINQASWKATVSKSSVSKVNFTMDFFDTIFTINSALVHTDLSAITGLIKKYTNHSFDEISKLTSPTVIKK